MAFGVRRGASGPALRRRWQHNSRCAVAATVMLALTAGLATGTAPVRAAAGRSAPSIARDPSIPVTPVVSHYTKPKPMPVWRPAVTSWPSGSADVTVQLAEAAAPTGTAARRQATIPVAQRAGSLPVWLSAATNGAPAAAQSSRSAAATTSVTARVTIAAKSSTDAAGVNGLLLTVARADGAAAPIGVHLTLSYSQFQDAFGGDWGSRLALVALPACAVTTPDVAACRTQTPVRSTNNVTRHTLDADLTLPAGSPVAPSAGSTRSSSSKGASTSHALASAPLVLAATSNASSSSGGGGGDFTATSLKASGSWQAGGSTDSFSWSYPIPVPQVPGGLQPNVDLAYDSQSQDGLTSSTNNQASVVGDGWNISESYIERSYQSCHQNPAGATQTYDNCWSSNNTLTLSLNGQTSTLVKDDTTGAYRAVSDSNERIQYLTGANNGAQNGEYWVVTTTDGTQYWFGYNRLPGYAAGDATTNSVDTEPVYATASGQPCYNATFANSWCQQAYRWNLDYVVDTHSDVMSYWYTTDTAYYAADLGTTANTPYVRDSNLTKIQYGQRAGQVYTTTPAGLISLSYNGRCNTSPTGCATSTLNSSTAANWPDVPYDLNCASGASCAMQAPSFWNENEVTGIQTQALTGSTLANVDSWALSHTFPATGDTTTPSLWLSSITRTGQDTTAEPSGGAAIALPSVVFTGTAMANRVEIGDGYPPITRQRMYQITTETGEVITVGYSAPACGSSTPSNDAQNTMLCYPVYWTPTGAFQPMKDYFNKYVVTTVTEDDKTGGGQNDKIVTTYTPVGSPAWHYNDNPLTPSSQRTWDQWRGYQGMTVSTGTAPDPVTKTVYTYFRGMNGDYLSPTSTRSVTLTDSRGDPAVIDASQYAGTTYETQVYNGTSLVTDTIADPWTSSATATHALSGGLPAQQAFITGTADQKVYTPLANGTTRQTETDYTHDAYGRVTQTNDQGDVTVAAQHLCTTTTFADNTTAWILNKAAETKTVSVPCSSTPSYPANAVSDTLTYYDGSTTLGAAPSVGDITMTQQAASYTGSTPNYVTTSTLTVDQYGRTLTGTDPDNRKTTTSYTPATGAEPTTVAVTDPLGHITTTTYDPLRDLTTVKTDPGGYATTEQYDALGRLIAVFKPGEPTTSAPNLKYSYTVSNSVPSVVDSYTLNDDGSTYKLSETLYDSMLRATEVQTQTPDNSRDITDTYYNTDGWVAETTAPYNNSSAVSTTLVQAQAGTVPSATGYTYDGDGRKTAAITYALGTETWRTTYTYGGNFTTAVPPAGATATTTVTDARGRTTDLIQYHSGVPTDYVTDPASDYSDTTYTYAPSGKQATMTDAAGNSWSWTYNLLGYQTDAYDPDTGHVQSTYDNAGQLLTSTDARGKQTTNTYDLDGRRTASYDTTSTQTLSSANQLTGFVYDTLKKGYPTSSTSYSNGDTYTTQVTGYTTLAEPKGTKVTLTGTDAALVPTSGYTTSYVYTTTGRLQSQNDPAAGGMASETITYGYDSFGEPVSVGGSGAAGTHNYIVATGYNEYGQPLLYTYDGSNDVWVELTYDPQTRGLTDINTTDATSSTVVDDLSYAYGNAAVSKGSGLLTSTVDSQNGTAVVDTQCYTYDYATRIQQAWTATDKCAATPTPGNSATVGGTLAPYWQSWTYDVAGNRFTQTDHDTTGNTANDTTTTYTYPTAGSATDQPHTLTSTSATGPNAAANTASYTYDASGNTTAITGGALGNQTLNWTDQGLLQNDTTSAGTTSYVYDASGNVIARRDPGSTTFYYNDEQITLNTATGTTTAVRYYTINGTTIAEQNSAGFVYYLIPDRQGTDQLSIKSDAAQTVTRRQYLPFGQTRGTAPTWVGGDTGYVGGHTDTTTSLETLGARTYDPAAGRFLSADPVLASTDPTQLDGYDYAGNNPVTGSDPSGLFCDGCGPSYYSNTNGSDVGCSFYWDGSSNGHCDGENVNLPGKPSTYCPDNNVECHLVQRKVDDTIPFKLFQKTGWFVPSIWQMVDWGDFDANLTYAQNVALYYRSRCSADMSQNGCLEIAEYYGHWSGLSAIPENPCGIMTLCGDLPWLVAGLAGSAAVESELTAAVAADGTDESILQQAKQVEGCLANSFTGATQVLMADGTSKPIDQVKIGDKIANAQPGAPQGTKDETHTVTAIHITRTDRDYTDITVATSTNMDPANLLHDGTVETLGGASATITGTAHHLYWDTTTSAWTEADHLRPGDMLQTADGRTVLILAVHDYTASMVTYNLTIDGLHTYYVEAGSTPVLVHNDGGDGSNPWSNSQEWTQGRIPTSGGPANGVLYRRGSGGSIVDWGVYDENGNLSYRVDLFGAAHGGVETPHWQPYRVNTNPQTGKVYVQETGEAFSGTGPIGGPPCGF